MEKSKKTFEEIMDFSQEAYKFVAKSEGETKLTYAIKKLIGDPKTGKKGTLAKVVKIQQSKGRDLAIDHASVDDKGILLTDERGQYRYSPANQKALDKAMDELASSEVELEAYYATEIVEELNDYQKEVFKGFVIN